MENATVNEGRYAPPEDALVINDRTAGLSPLVLKVNQEDTEGTAEFQAFHDPRDSTASETIAIGSGTETSAASSVATSSTTASTSHDDQPIPSAEPRAADQSEVTAYIEYPVRMSVRPRLASYDDGTTTTGTDSWNVEEKRNRAIVLSRFEAATSTHKPPPRRLAITDMARLEHERRMEIMNQEWIMKRRLLDMKLRAVEMKLEAYRWKAEYFELATKRRSSFENDGRPGETRRDYEKQNGHW